MQCLDNGNYKSYIKLACTPEHSYPLRIKLYAELPTPGLGRLPVKMEVDMRLRCLCAASVVLVILVSTMLGCSKGGGGAILPDVAGTDVEMPLLSAGQDAGQYKDLGKRYLWGLWIVNLNEDHTEFEVIPVRDAAFHLNVVGYLEHDQQNLRIQNLSQTANDTITMDVVLDHPFDSNIALTGRDVRGIAIFNYSKIFPSTLTKNVHGEDAQIAASRVLVNADGYTALWNRWTSEAVQYPQIFGYIRGKLATLDEMMIEGNLHGYKNFYTDPILHVFQVGEGTVVNYEFDFPPGRLSFAYAVDANWDVPINKPVGDIWNDFAVESASCPEPYQISASILSNTLSKLSGTATIQFDVMDWQDPTNFSHIHVEAPDLFYGIIDPSPPVGYPNANTARYEVTVTNDKGSAVTAGGGSDLLVVVEDAVNTNDNPDLTAYNIFRLPVVDDPGFWRDRNGDGTYVNVILGDGLLEPSSLSTGQPDLAVVSYPDPSYQLVAEGPEILLFDDINERFLVYDRELDSSFIKSGYPGDPSWILYPHAIDTTVNGWFGVASTNDTAVVGNYRVRHLVNIFKQGGFYGYSWHTGTDSSGWLENARDVTAGIGNLVGDPLYALFAYDSGTVPVAASVLSVGFPYITPSSSNTFRAFLPMQTGPYVPQAIRSNSERLKCAIDTEPNGLPNLHYAFYVVESDPSASTSEIEGFDINFSSLPILPLWNVTNGDIQAEFPGAFALDCEVVPSWTKHVTLIGVQTAQYNWLCVLMRDANNWWLAFYDPLNPAPGNPTNNPLRTVYKTVPVPLTAGEPLPVAIDVDHNYFEVYVLAEDAGGLQYMSAYEYFYFLE